MGKSFGAMDVAISRSKESLVRFLIYTTKIWDLKLVCPLEDRVDLTKLIQISYLYIPINCAPSYENVPNSDVMYFMCILFDVFNKVEKYLTPHEALLLKVKLISIVSRPFVIFDF